VGDMEGMYRKSLLTCFSEKDKNIRYNIYLLGTLVAKLPGRLSFLGEWIIRVFPPNLLFVRIKRSTVRFFLERIIFKLKA
jgi:hypothetical protein